jgi:hypothetical integral membrane protein (TIGR02206 family)
MSLIIHNAIFLFKKVEMGSFEHVLPVFFAFIIGFFAIKYVIRKFNNTKKDLLFNILGIAISLTIILFHGYKIALGSYNISTDLPLYLCSLMALLIPVFTYYRKFWMYEILLFWIIAGTSQGVITPDIPAGFPSFDYYRYWVVHLGLLLIIFYATFVFKMRPKFKSVFKSFFALQLYIIIIVMINYILNSNYFYLNEKPQAKTLLDYFGDWPIYIIVTQIIVIPYFLLIYLPFYFTDKKK